MSFTCFLGNVVSDVCVSWGVNLILFVGKVPIEVEMRCFAEMNV